MLTREEMENSNGNDRFTPPTIEATTITDRAIQDLIQLPKAIQSKTPARGYKEESRYRRCTLSLQAVDERFTVFVRQNKEFIENFSIGLRYLSGDRTLGTITLIRFNGPHGETSRDPDGHYAVPHIHRISLDELKSGSTEPPEKRREMTDRYATFDQALDEFLDEIGVTNRDQYFPASRQLRLFDEP